MRKKHPKDGNHGKRGLVSGNERYCRAALERFLGGRRVKGLTPWKNASMGKN